MRSIFPSLTHVRGLLRTAVRRGLYTLAALAPFIALVGIVRKFPTVFSTIKQLLQVKAAVLRSRLIECVRRPVACISRKDVQDTVKLNVLDLPARHSHRQAAQLRNAANVALKQVAQVNGYKPYCVSNSSSDELHDGERLIYCDRDSHRKIRQDDITADSVLIMIDVDYYAGMHHYLSYGVPILMFTFAPDSVSGVVPDGYYVTNSDSSVTYHVTGGATYTHHLWDYRTDYLRHTMLSETIIYTVDSWLCPDTTRQIIALVPTVRIPHVFGLLYSLFTSGFGLRRKQYSYSKSVVWNRYFKDGKVWLSIGLVGHDQCVDLPESTYEAIKIRFVNSKHKEISTIERMLSSEKIDKPGILGAILFKLLQDDVDITPGDVTLSTGFVPSVAVHYQAIGPLVTEDGNLYARIVAPPIVTEDAEVPVESFNNDVACIEGRITMVENNVVPPPIYDQYATEYVKWLIGDAAGTGCPVSYDYVQEKQNTAVQRARAERERMWLGTDPEFRVKAFQKRETYAKVTDPRNISTVPGDQLARLSQFTYAFKEDVLKKHKWYQPCNTPQEIAACVQELCDYFEKIEENDQERFDGHHSRWIRVNVEFASYKCWVRQEYRNEVSALLRSELRAKAVTKSGFRYNTGNTRLSGSSVTTDGNTGNNGFMNFCVARLSGLEPHEIKWHHIGLCFGDDGGRGFSNGLFAKVCQDLGFRVKTIIRTKGEPFVFLGRVFLDPWNSNLSIQDPVRTIRKLHLTMTSNDVPAHIAAASRALGYLATDATTPIIGSYCRAVLRCISWTMDEFRQNSCVPWNNRQWDAELIKDKPYWAQHTDLYSNGSWPTAEIDLAYEYVASQFMTSVEALKDIEDVLQNAESFEEFPFRVLHAVTTSTIVAQKSTDVGHPLTDGRITGVAEPKQHAEKPKETKQTPKVWPKFEKRKPKASRGSAASKRNGATSGRKPTALKP